MKLRIRSLESKETLKIDVVSSSPSSTTSLQDLKQAIAEKISASSDNLYLSLNRKDRIDASPQHSLQSIGIASGDLIFYTQNPNGFVSGETLTQFLPIVQQQTQIHASHNIDKETLKQGEKSHDSDMVDRNPVIISTSNLEKNIENGESSRESNKGDFNSGEIDETLNEEDEIMGFSEEGSDEDPNSLVENSSSSPSSSSVPCFLRKVLEEEKGNTEGDYNLLVIAVHAVLLESGFVGFDSDMKKKIHGFRLPEGWTSESNSVSIKYTVPDLLKSGGGGDSVETVVLKFLTWGKFVKVYGSLSRNGVQLYQLCLDKSQFVPSIDFLWMKNASVDEKEDGSSKSSHESKVFEFWKIAKDKLALPLLIDLCERTGLPSPPCFMRLPFDLKIRILEFLPGVDIAKFSCVSSELRYISSNNDLWRQKFLEEFPSTNLKGTVQDCWKEKFVPCWKSRANQRARQRARIRQLRRPYNPRRGEFDMFRPREPHPIPFPGIIGGDYDLFPAPFGSHRVLRLPGRQNFIRHCNLGGHNI